MGSRAALFAMLGGTAAATGLLTTGCSSLSELATGTRILTDDTGREVELPIARNLSRIYFTSSLAEIFCFTLAPDLLAGTAIRFDEAQLAYLPHEMGDLPYWGTLAGGGTIDASALVRDGVQAIFSISGVGLTDVNIADALLLQDVTGIPVFLIDGSLDRLGDSYRLLGEALGCQMRAEEIATYCESVYAEVLDAVAAVPQSEHVSYYFAEGPEGLQTEPNDSQHALAFLLAGGENVAADVPLNIAGYGMTSVTMEQVQQWDPEFIIAWDWATRAGAADLIRSSSKWQDIAAVRDGRVYAMPALPFPFCDRPPGINRIIGMQWMANLFYPRYYDIDIIEAVRKFYATCYWCNITRDEASQILRMSQQGS